MINSFLHILNYFGDRFPNRSGLEKANLLSDLVKHILNSLLIAPLLNNISTQKLVDNGQLKFTEAAIPKSIVLTELTEYEPDIIAQLDCPCIDMLGIISRTGDSQHRESTLTFDQVNRLNGVINETVPVHGRNNFPTLHIPLKQLIQSVKRHLEKSNVTINDIRLNGSAASHVVSLATDVDYNDIDLIFRVDLSKEGSLECVKDCVFDALAEFYPKKYNKRVQPNSLKDAYVNKMVKVIDVHDRWSLISLANHSGRNIELKFVDKMRRQYEFSVDSFQVILDSLLQFDLVTTLESSRQFFPTVIVESVYGDIVEALRHLDNKLICTHNPEEIRGGGLFKYCNLLVHGYSPSFHADERSCISAERYMCSRFFIDFPDLPNQRLKLESYLSTHFPDDSPLKLLYLSTLYRVVDQNTVCLMGHERRSTLQLIEEFSHGLHYALFAAPRSPSQYYHDDILSVSSFDSYDTELSDFSYYSGDSGYNGCYQQLYSIDSGCRSPVSSQLASPSECYGMAFPQY